MAVLFNVQRALLPTQSLLHPTGLVKNNLWEKKHTQQNIQLQSSRSWVRIPFHVSPTTEQVAGTTGSFFN